MTRPRSRWKTWAAAAACFALIAAAYPLSQAFRPQGPAPGPEATQGSSTALVQRPGLHAYTLFEQGGQIAFTQGEAKAPSGSMEGPAPIPESTQPPLGSGSALPGGAYVGDAPSQEEASAQYDRLLQSLGLWGIDARGLYPEWCGGIWLDGEHLAVAIVDGFRTPELEAQVRSWCGGTGEILFTGVKYSQNYLDGLMDQISQVFDELDCRISSVYGVYVMDNYLGLEFYGEVPGDEVLAALAELDPAGDAIQIQVFPGGHVSVTDGSAEKPATGPIPGAAVETAQPAKTEDSYDIPGGTTGPR